MGNGGRGGACGYCLHNQIKTWREAFFIFLFFMERKRFATCSIFKKSVYPSGATIPVVVEVGEH